jgi:hypothetical protein
MNNERYNQIVDAAYNEYSKAYEKDNSVGITVMTRGEDGVSYRKPNKEMFVEMCKYKYDQSFWFAERWGLKIEERELTLEERLDIADKFNPLIREDCLTKTHHPDESDELKLKYRHEWLDSLGPNVVPQRKLIKVTYKDETIEDYE